MCTSKQSQEKRWVDTKAGSLYNNPMHVMLCVAEPFHNRGAGKGLPRVTLLLGSPTYTYIEYAPHPKTFVIPQSVKGTEH